MLHYVVRDLLAQLWIQLILRMCFFVFVFKCRWLFLLTRNVSCCCLWKYKLSHRACTLVGELMLCRQRGAISVASKHLLNFSYHSRWYERPYFETYMTWYKLTSYVHIFHQYLFILVTLLCCDLDIVQIYLHVNDTQINGFKGTIWLIICHLSVVTVNHIFLVP